MVRLLLAALLLLARPALADDDLRIEVEAAPLAPLVQAEVVYTVRLWRASSLQHGYLVVPEVPDAVVETLQESERVQGRWRVMERRMAIFPQRSGQLMIPPPVFSGRDSFFRGQAVTLDVRPKPEGLHGRWTPARTLTVREDWRPAPDRAVAGAPLERTVVIEAEGLTGAQLPPLPPPRIEGLRAVGAEAVVDNAVTEGRLVGRRTERQLFVPDRSGRFTVPPVRLAWWDVAAATPREAALAAVTVSVAAAAASVPEPITAPAAPVPPPTKSLAPLAALAGLPAAALVLLIGLRRPSPRRLARRAFRRHESELADACRAGDAGAARLALLAWARLAWPEEPPSLRLLARRISAAAAALTALEATLYGPRCGGWNGGDGRTLLPALRRHRRPGGAASPLPPLDPYSAR